MNQLFDYIFVQLHEFYNSFENEPSLYASKLIVALLQFFLLMNMLNVLSYFVVIPGSFIGIAMIPLIVILYLRLHSRYSNKDLFDSLVTKYRNKNKDMRLITGIGSLLLLVATFILAMIFGRFTH